MHKSDSFKDCVFNFLLFLTLATWPWNLQVYEECATETDINKYKQSDFPWEWTPA